MNIVNNQYKIVQELGGNPIAHFVVEDILNANQRLEMLMFDRSVFSGDVYQFLKRFYLHAYAFSGELFLRNLAFATVKNIDGLKKDGSFLCYCIEYEEEKIPLTEWLPGREDIRDTVEVFHTLLRGFNYFLLRGLPQNAFLPKDLFVVEKGDQYAVRHRDLVSTQIEYMQSSNYRGELEDGFFFSEENRTVDMEALAEMFLLILEGEMESNPLPFDQRCEELLSTSIHRESEDFRRLVSFVKDLADGVWDSRVQNFYRVFAYFSESFSVSPVIEYGDPISLMAKNPIIVGRDEEISHVLQIMKDRSYSEKPGILFLKGASGSGKTRFLRELDFQFHMENELTISSFQAGPENTDAPLKDFFKAYSDFFVSYYSREKRHEYMERLQQVKNYFAQGQDQQQLNEGFRTIFQATNLLSELVHNQRIIFLIDNFEYVNTVVLDAVLYFLTDSMLREKLFFIVAFDPEVVEEDLKFERFFHMTKSMCDVYTMEMKPLDISKTMTMMKSILLTTKSDIALSQRLYMETSGSPRWISKILREYVFNSYVSINMETGQWEFFEDRLEQQKISSSMETFDFSGVDALSTHERRALQVLSCFRDSTSIENISKIVEIDLSIALQTIHKLVALGVVEVYYEGNVRMVGIPNRSIAGVIYARLSEEQKKFYHERILECLDFKFEEDVLESLTQYRALGRQIEAKKVALKIAGNRRRNNPRSAIVYYKMALEFIPEHRYEEEAQTRFVLSEIFMSFGDFSESLHILEGVEKVYPYLSNVRLKEMYIYYRARLSMLIDDERRLKHCWKLIRSLPLNQRTNMAPAIRMKIEADLKVMKGKISQALQDYLRIVSKHEGDEEYDMILMDCYRWYAHFSKGLVQTPKRLEIHEKVVKYAERIGDTRTMLASMANMANIYILDYYDYGTAIEMFDRIVVQSRHGMHLALEFFSLNNLAFAEEMRGNHSKALEVLEVALRRAEVVGRNNDRYLVIEGMLRTHYKQGNYKKFEFLREEHRSFLEGEVSNPNYLLSYEILFDYYFAVGDYEEALHQITKMLKWRPKIPSKELREWFAAYNLTEMLLQGRYRENDILSYIQYLYDHATDSDDQDSYTRLYRGLEMLFKKFGYATLKNTLLYVQKLEKFAWTPRNRMYVYFFRAMTVEDNDSDALEYLYFSKLAMRKYQRESLGMTIHYETARRLVKYGANNEALIHLMDGILNVVRVMREMPEQYAENYFNQHQFAGVFRIFEKYHQTGVFVLQESDYVPADTEEIQHDLTTLVEDLLSRNNRTVELIITEKLRYRGYPRDLVEMLCAITGDRKKNIHRILEYFATTIFATEAFIFLKDGMGEYQVFSSFYANVPTVNPTILTKYLTSKTVQIEEEPGFVKEYPHINALASFPLVDNKKRRSERSQGYIVFLSDNNAHLFHTLSENYQLLGLQLLVSCLGSYELKQLVSIDKLTGALTRKYLFDVLDVAFKKKKLGEISTLAMFDLDHFKRVNDSYGHQVGDLVLKATAKLVMENLPEQCKVGRYGGEEFVILFPAMEEPKALELGQGLLKKMEELKFTGYPDLHVTMSMGIRQLHPDDSSVDEWIEKADRALYYAKDSGRNQCVAYRPDFADNVVQEDLLYGVVSHDEWKDGRIIVTLTEMMLLKRQRHHLTRNLEIILTRAMELLSVREAGVILLLSDNRERGYYKELGKSDFFTGVRLKGGFIDRIKKSEQSLNLVDWEDLPEEEGIVFPAWNSRLIVPIFVNGAVKGMLYLRSSLKERIFDSKDVNLAEALSSVIGVYLSREDYYEYD